MAPFTQVVSIEDVKKFASDLGRLRQENPLTGAKAQAGYRKAVASMPESKSGRPEEEEINEGAETSALQTRRSFKPERSARPMYAEALEDGQSSSLSSSDSKPNTSLNISIPPGIASRSLQTDSKSYASLRNVDIDGGDDDDSMEN